MGRNLRSTRKGKDANKDYSKLNEGSRLLEEDEVEPVPTSSSKKASKKQKALAKQKKSKQQQEEPAQVASARGSDDDIDSGDSIFLTNRSRGFFVAFWHMETGHHIMGTT